ncbi:efflux RND transporter permease subunit [Balneolales bacterium ANBcel1]|nr:efflux RND transporter permease subunit [Balneolales bacterium ANBcel1]
MKNLSRLAVNRPVTFLMASLILIGFGIFGLMNLRLNLYPDVSFPTVTVYTTYEGVAPEDIETLITRPIEETVGSVSGIQRVRSQSSQGASVVRLNFDWGTDLFFAETEVRKQLDMIRRTLPRDAEQPVVFSYDPNDEPVVVLTLTSQTRSPRELRTIATQQLEQRIERISGVASAATAGGYERQINIRLRNADMRAYNLSISDIAATLRDENIQVPAGQLEEGETTYSLRTVGDFRNIDQIRSAIVGTNEGNPVYLRDVARVEDGIAQPIGNVRVQGNDGVILNVYRQSDSNVVMAAGGVMGSLDDLRAILPSGVQLDVLTNQADFIEMSIRNLILTGLQAVFLVMLMLLLFLRSGRSSLIVAISIPVSIIATFSIMHWADVSMNIISLSGLTLAVGLVVDNAVVVLENIFRFREDGESGRDAAMQGAREVSGPVVMSTLTTLVVFLPVLFVPGIAGLLFRDLALTVSFALIVSVLVALTLIPVMASRFFGWEQRRKEAEASESDAGSERESSTDKQTSPGTQQISGADRNPSALRRLLEWRRRSITTRILSIPVFLVFLPVYPVYRALAWLFHLIGTFFAQNVAPALGRGFDRVENGYRQTIDNVLHRSGLTVLFAFLLLLISLPIFYQLGGEFFPEVDENRIVLEVQREPGVNLFELERTIRQVEEVIAREVPETRLVVSDYGDKIGIEGADNPGGNQGVVRIELVPVQDRSRSQFQITASLLEALMEVPAANIRELREDPLSPDGETGLIVQIYGFDPEVREDLAYAAMQRMRGIEGITGLFSTADQGRPELRLIMDRERIARVGMTTAQVTSAVSDAVRGNLATTFVDQGIEFEVLVQLDPFDRAHSGMVDEIQIRTPQGDWMPLKNLARIERVTGPASIHRINQERMVEVNADLGGIDLQTATQRTRDALNTLQWPEGYRYEVGGAAEDQQRSFFYLMIAFIVAGVLTYMVMASQFESLLEPLIIIVTIPLALTGVLLMLWATGTPVSVTAMVGLVLLTGIVVNNGIVMIDYIKILQARGQERHQAIVNGASRRLRPILMTALTTILAMTPLALQLGAGSETWSPMARTVIGGLAMSTLLMLFAVPCMYNLVNRMAEKAGFTGLRKEDPLVQEG